MVALTEVIFQLAQQAPGVRIALAVSLTVCEEQAHQQVAAALSAEARLDQLDGKLPARLDVVRVEQAVVGDAQRLGQEFGIRAARASSSAARIAVCVPRK